MMYVNIISVKATGIKYGGWICVPTKADTTDFLLMEV